MLQNDIGENDNDGFIVPVTPITPGAADSPTRPQSPRRNRPRGKLMTDPTLGRAEQSGEQFISYLHFLSRYWNHFPHSVTRVLGMCMMCHACSISNRGGRVDPALVFGEILGVIKGSEKAVTTQHRCLDRDTYLSSGRRGTHSHTKETVYDLFTAYTRLKRQRQEYDAADRSAPHASLQE